MGAKTYTRDDFEPFIGKGGRPFPAPLPNAEDVDPLEFLNNLAAGGHMMEPVWGYTLLPDGSRPQWTQLFLSHDANMGFELSGRGYAVSYGGGRYDQKQRKSIPSPIVRRFAICNHERVLAAGANPDRGWRPGHCKHCGMDMTIDSGD